MKKHAAQWKTALLAGAVAALVLCGSVGTSMSYFTTYVTADGTQTLNLKMTIPHIEEEHEGHTKAITVENTGERDCYVRVAWFAPAGIPCTAAGEAGWSDGGDGYWYYSTPLTVSGDGKASATLRITPAIPAEVTQDFSIEVIVESAPLLYDTDGTLDANGPGYAGWAIQAQESKPITGNP